MKKLPNYLADVPDYEWNPRTQMYDAKLYTLEADGSKVYTESYSIPEHTFLMCIARMQEAVRKKPRSKLATVVPLKQRGKKQD